MTRLSCIIFVIGASQMKRSTKTPKTIMKKLKGEPDEQPHDLGIQKATYFAGRDHLSDDLRLSNIFSLNTLWAQNLLPLSP